MSLHSCGLRPLFSPTESWLPTEPSFHEKSDGPRRNFFKFRMERNWPRKHSLRDSVCDFPCFFRRDDLSLHIFQGVQAAIEKNGPRIGWLATFLHKPRCKECEAHILVGINKFQQMRRSACSSHDGNTIVANDRRLIAPPLLAYAFYSDAMFAGFQFPHGCRHGLGSRYWINCTIAGGEMLISI